jgi:hypothetical protein
MSTSVNVFPLEDLKDIELSIINKLKKAGILSMHDLAVASPVELVFEREIGTDVDAMAELIMKAKKTLIDCR